MYKLIDGTELNNEQKRSFRENITEAYITYYDEDSQQTVELSYNNYLKKIDMNEERFVPDEGFIGQAVERELTIEFNNINSAFNLTNKEIEYYQGARQSDNSIIYINFGKFIVLPPENDNTKEITKFTARDYMHKFNKVYNCRLTVPFTYYDLVQDMCDQVGVELGSTQWRNSSALILSNPFINNEQCRFVLKCVAKDAFSVAYIGQDNKLYIGFDNAGILDNITPAETYTIDDYEKLEINEPIKPITIITLKSGEVEAQRYSIYADGTGGTEDLISIYGENELVIAEDYLAYTQEIRQSLLQAAKELFGLTYVPIKVNLIGSVYLGWNDIIGVQDLQGNILKTYCINQSASYNGTLYNTVNSPILPSEAELYHYENEQDLRNRKTEIDIDKANQKITSMVTDISNQNTKISQITQTVDELLAQISDIADITTYGESDRANVELTDVNESEPIMLKVHPTISSISYLYPRNDLYPSDLQYLPDRIVRFTRTYNENGTTKTENIDYTLPDDLLRYSDTVYDEFYLDYETQTCLVTKRCGYNADGTVKALDTEVVTNYPYPTIVLGEGNYTITIPGYDYGYIYVRLMAKNIYTTQFYTKAETNSKIDQKADSINLSVDQKLSNYSTTNEMNAAIALSAGEITSTVSSNYATKGQLNSATAEIKQTTDSISSTVSTKVGNNEIISKINQTSESYTIDASKISLAGKTINLTSDNIAITSTNFIVDKNGNLACSSANIKGKVTATSGKIAGYTINGNMLVGTNVGISGQSGEGLAFWAGNSTPGSAPFRVNHSGVLYASNANIAGTITATSGKIAGYTINGNMLVGTNVGISGKSGEGYAFWAGNSTPGSAPFRVNHAGAVYASNVNIVGGSLTIGSTFGVTSAGALTASKGTIGGFTIGASSIVAEGSNYRVSLLNASNANKDFLVVRTGSSDNYSFPFYVRGDGTLKAEKAIISGTINATNGTFKNCTITNSCTVPASTITGVLAAGNIPNINANKITSGTMSASRISGGTMSSVDIDAGRISASGTISSADIEVQNGFSCRGDEGVSYYSGQTYVIVNDGERGWSRLTFKGGILVNIETSW